MYFLEPIRLLLFIPLLILTALYYVKQARSAKALQEAVSSRFIKTLTFFSSKKYRVLHNLLCSLCGAGLILASAAPVISGISQSENQDKAIIIIIDASLSMICNDVTAPAEIEKPSSRLEYAKVLSLDIVKRLPNLQYALISFSGDAIVHTPLTNDLWSLSLLIQKLSTHNYSKSGTNFNAALSTALYQLRDNREIPCQLILFSDGEELSGSSVDESIERLKNRGIPVHTVVMGGEVPLSLQLYEPEDVINRVAKPRIAKTITTSRSDETLKKITEKTDGTFFIANRLTSIENIVDAVSTTSKSIYGLSNQQSDFSSLFLIIFALLFLIDVILIDSLHFIRRHI